MVPLVLGFHPEDSVVVLTFGPGRRPFSARVDLPRSEEEQRDVADMLTEACAANGVDRAAVLVYTDDVDLARGQGVRMLDRLLGAGVAVIDVVRVAPDRWFAVLEDDEHAGAAGTAYDLSTHPFTARSVFEGQRVHRDRRELVATLVADDPGETAAITGLAAEQVRRADAAAHPTRFWAREARWLQQRVREQVATGEPVGTADAARLLVLANEVPVRDVAWAEIDRQSAEAHVELWRDLVRRCPPHLLPGPSSLLAFGAWQAGDGALAWCALDRCHEADPAYSMADCVAQLLVSAVPPHSWTRIPQTALRVLHEAG